VTPIEDINVVGVDPGLVHTGVVGISISFPAKTIRVSDEIVLGPDPQGVKDFMAGLNIQHVYIEGYRTRGQFNTNDRMVRAVQNMKAELSKSVVVPNMGIKKVVKPPLLSLLGLTNFRTSNHRDLESAARILVLGMLKDGFENHVIADIVRDNLEGRKWDVR